MDTNNIKEQANKYKEKGIDILKEKKAKIKKVVITTLVGTVVLGGLGATGAYAYLKSNVNYSQNQLEKVALKMVPGKVVSVKKGIDDDNLSISYEFKIKDENNMLSEVEVDSKTGAITDIDNNYQEFNNKQVKLEQLNQPETTK